jgi:4-hydroxybenzoate polyprenyltransferase
MRIKPYLQLVRLPNVFTAAADSLAGWLLTGGSLAEPGRWLPLTLASMSIYAAGIALNDWFDYAIDLEERPGRPLPSGRVSRRFAAALGGLLLVAGPALASLSGSATSVMIAMLLSSLVLTYDAVAKRSVFGPEVMGACRGLNLLLGMSQAPALGGPAAWWTAVMLAVFVAGVTWISRSEAAVSGPAGSGHSVGILAGIVLENLALAALLAVAVQPRSFPAPRSEPSLVAGGALVLLIVAFLVNRANVAAVRAPHPARVQRAVKTGVLSLVWLNVGMVLAVRGVAAAAAVAVLWLPAFLLARWLYTT